MLTDIFCPSSWSTVRITGKGTGGLRENGACKNETSILDPKSNVPSRWFCILTLGLCTFDPKTGNCKKTSYTKYPNIPQDNTSIFESRKNT